MSEPQAPSESTFPSLVEILNILEDYQDYPPQILEMLLHPTEEVLLELEQSIRAETEAKTYLGPASEIALAVLIDQARTSALPLVIEAFSVDEALEQHIFGDFITEMGAETLGLLGMDNPQAVKALADRRDISSWIVRAAMEACIVLHAQEVVTTAELDKWINGWLDEALLKKDRNVADSVTNLLIDYTAEKFFPKLELIIDQDLGGEWGSLKEFQADLREFRKSPRQILVEAREKAALKPWLDEILRRVQPNLKPRSLPSSSSTPLPLTINVPSSTPPLSSFTQKADSYGRNDLVRITKDGQSVDMKFKKAEQMLQVGWKLVGRVYQ